MKEKQKRNKMTYEQVKELENSIKENNGVFPEWTKGLCYLLEGMKIIQKYDNTPYPAAGHDVIYYGFCNEEMLEEDLKKLFELNWGITNEFGDNNFYHFV